MNTDKLLKQSSDQKNVYKFELEPNPPSGCWGKRHIQYLLSSMSIGILYVIKVNLSIAIVAMTDQNSTYNNTAQTFNWDKRLQNLVSSAFFFGYFIMMVPSGILAHRYGAKLLIVISLVFCSIMSICFPLFAFYGNWYAASANRFLQGMACASVMPSAHNIVGKWAPLLERGRATAFIHIGGVFGRVLLMTISGYLCVTSVGWPLVFYISGAIMFTMAVLMCIFGASSPGEHSTISKEEFDYIQRSSGSESGTKNLITPWKSILTSIKFWAIVCTQCAYVWGLSTLLLDVPSYMNYILKFDIRNNGLLNAGPYLIEAIMIFVISNTLDHLIKKGKISVTTSRKISNTIGTWVIGLLLVVFSFIPSDQVVLATIVLFACMIADGGINSGFPVAHIDLAPNFAGIAFSTGGTFANFFGALSPLVNGAIISDANDVNQWRYAFGLTGAILFVGNLIFLIFGTSKVQPWNYPKSDADAETLKNSP